MNKLPLHGYAIVVILLSLLSGLVQAQTNQPPTAYTTPDSEETSTPTQTDLPADVPASMLQQVQHNIQNAEYLIAWQEQRVLPDKRATYLAHNQRTHYTRDGARAILHATVTSDWHWGMQLVGVGSATNIEQLAHTVNASLLPRCNKQLKASAEYTCLISSYKCPAS